jgi:hypothetical protein
MSLSCTHRLSRFYLRRPNRRMRYCTAQTDILVFRVRVGVTDSLLRQRFLSINFGISALLIRFINDCHFFNRKCSVVSDDSCLQRHGYISIELTIRERNSHLCRNRLSEQIAMLTLRCHDQIIEIMLETSIQSTFISYITERSFSRCDPH